MSFSQPQIGFDVASEHIHAKSSGQADHLAPNVAGSDDSQCLVLQVEATQSYTAELMRLTHPPDTFPYPARQHQNKSEGKLGNRARAIRWHVANGDLALPADLKSNVIHAAGAGNDQP